MSLISSSSCQRQPASCTGTIAVAIFHLALLGWPESVGALEPSDFTIKMIRDQWQSRQEQVKSVRMNWRENRVFRTSHRASGMWHGDPNSPGGLAKIEYERRVQIDGDKIEYRSEAADAVRHNESPIIRETFDGQRSQSFSVDSDNKKSGALTNEVYSYTAQSLPLFPLYWAFRPLHASMGAFNLDKATIDAHSAVIDEGEECLVLRLNANNRNVRELWLDPKIELLPRRYLETIDGVPAIKLDITYSQDSALGPLPNGWKFDWLDEKGQFYDSSEMSVTDYAINPSIPITDFQIAFPDGTLVSDGTNGTRYVVGATMGQSTQRLLLILVNALVLAIISLVIFLRWRSQKNVAK